MSPLALAQPEQAFSESSAYVPGSEIDARAGVQYNGDGLAVVPSKTGAFLRCVFQKLEGEATAEGLWLSSTASADGKGRFRVLASAIGRSMGPSAELLVCDLGNACNFSRSGLLQIGDGARHKPVQRLPHTGAVRIDGKKVQFIRPSVIEEYSVSMDGVRQDFIIEPSMLNQGAGELRVELEVEGAQVEQTTYGLRLVMEGSGRQIAYSRLHVVDATGRELRARIEAGLGTLCAREERLSQAKAKVVRPYSSAASPTQTAAARTFAVLVDDRDAVYPIRIDPTFSDQNWISMGGFQGTDGVVSAAVVDGSGNLYIGGGFMTVGEVPAQRIAKWDGTRWSALGAGIGGEWGYVYALASSGTNLYAAGVFQTAGGITASNIAKWDGSVWSALKLGMSGGDWPTVLALAVLGSDLYAGGHFTTADGVAATNIAKWDGTSWSALGLGMNGEVTALTLSGNGLYAGGYFTTAGGITASNIAKWDGSSWSALGLGMNGGVSALTLSGNDLYAGGWFSTAGGIAATNIAKWDGGGWSALGSGIGADDYFTSVYALVVSSGGLYAGGSFRTACGTETSGIAKWNGNSWSTLGPGFGGTLYEYGPAVLALALSGPDLYAAGDFTMAGGIAVSGIAKWDGNCWSVPGLRASGSVLRVSAVLAVSGNDLYAGGVLATPNGTVAHGVAQWDGTNWSALGSGVMNGWVHALAISGEELYAAGDFTTAGGIAANHIAKWDGSGWSALGSGMSGGDWPTVRTLAVLGSNLFAGGYFTIAGGVAARHIAGWDGTHWSALGSGIVGIGGYASVDALAVSGSDLYVAGRFTTAGGIVVNNVAKWNGINWSALGSGISAFNVYALAVSSHGLYVGGWFTRAGDVEATNIAKWDGSSWSALDSGISGDGSVHALAVSGSDLYAGGHFTRAGAITANNIAKWDGTNWSALGWGISGGDWPTVSALAISGSDLYAGGHFRTAGGKISVNAAKAVIILPANMVSSFLLTRDFVARFDGTPGVPYTIEYTDNLLPTAWQKATNITAPRADFGLGFGVFEFRDSPANAPHRFYRAVYPAY